MAEARGEIHVPGHHSYIVREAGGIGCHVALARGEAVEVLVASHVRRERDGVRQLVGIGGIRGHEIHAVHDAVDARSVVDACGAVGLRLAVAVVACVYAYVFAYARRGVGVVDQTSCGVKLLVGEVVFLPRETCREREAAEEYGAQVYAEAMIVVGQVIGAQRCVVGLNHSVEELRIEALQREVGADVAGEACHGRVARREHFVEALQPGIFDAAGGLVGCEDRGRRVGCEREETFDADGTAQAHNEVVLGLQHVVPSGVE